MIFGQDAKYDYFPFECASLPLWRLLATFTVLSFAADVLILEMDT